jgi:glutaredoxin
MILESKGITYETVDITEPGKEDDKEFMQKNSKLRDENDRNPLPPQIFNDTDYCGVSLFSNISPSRPHPPDHFCHAECL